MLVLALAATGFVVWSVRRAFPDVDGRLALPGLTTWVTVVRDRYGIPQLYADNAHDLFEAQGYVHAQDRFWEMDFRRHVTAGRLAELFGPDQVPTDAFLRTSGWRRVAEQEWTILAPDTRAYLQAYADGVNAWIQANGGPTGNGVKSLEYTVLGLTTSGYTVEPWTPIDSLAWLKAMAWDLRGNMEQEIDRASLLAAGLTRDQIEQLYPGYPYDRNAPIVPTGGIVDGTFDAAAPVAPVPPATATVLRDAAPALSAVSAAVRRVPTLLGDNASGDIGSNSWVIGGALTTTGKPLLANDPHLSPSMPGIWYQMGLHCSCPYNVEGFTFSGVPGVVIGHNARIAWGFTNLNPDVSDLYLEKVDGDKVFDGTTWVPLTVRTETIKVAGADPVTITVRASKHGPLLSDRSGELAGIAAAPPVDASGSPQSRLTPGPTPSLDASAPGVPPAASSLGYAVALRWTALDPGHTADALFLLNTAANWTDFRRAASMFEVPAQNLVYADVDGNIGYQSPGKVPVRGKGDGRWPAPGWDPAYDWTGYLPVRRVADRLQPAGRLHRHREPGRGRPAVPGVPDPRLGLRLPQPAHRGPDPGAQAGEDLGRGHPADPVRQPQRVRSGDGRRAARAAGRGAAGRRRAAVHMGLPAAGRLLGRRRAVQRVLAAPDDAHVRRAAGRPQAERRRPVVGGDAVAAGRPALGLVGRPRHAQGGESRRHPGGGDDRRRGRADLEAGFRPGQVALGRPAPARRWSTRRSASPASPRSSGCSTADRPASPAGRRS